MSDLTSPKQTVPFWRQIGRSLFWPLFVVAAIGFASIFVLNQSKEFSYCVHEGKQTQQYKSLDESRSILVKRIIVNWRRAGLYVGCAGHFTDKNGDALVALATIVLAFFTGTLWNATKRLADLASTQARDIQQLLIAAKNNTTAAASQAKAMRDLHDAAVAQEAAIRAQASATSSVADAAAKSANIAERALTDLERPFICVVVTKPGLKISDTGMDRGDFEITFINVGRTPAMLTRIFYKFDVCDREAGIEQIYDPCKIGGRAFPDNTIAVRDFPYTEITAMRLSFFDEENDIVKSNLRVWVSGFLRYRDIFGNHFIVGFCQVFDPIRIRFVSRGDEQRNYARSERSDEIPEVSFSPI